jgi:hypothetical protein
MPKYLTFEIAILYQDIISYKYKNNVTTNIVLLRILS